MFAYRLTNSSSMLAIALLLLAYLPITASEEPVSRDGSENPSHN